MGEPPIRVNRLSISFNGIKALNNLSFEVKEHEIMSVVGPSGCGKTTLLKAISGLIDNYKGEINKKGDIGIMFQEPRLMKWRNLRENIELGLQMSGQDNHSRVDQLIRELGLEGFEENYPPDLSGGMKQRVSLARTLAPEPDTLLMDEPLSSLDKATRFKLQNLFKKIHREREKTTLFVTHSIREAIELGDRIMVLSKRPAKIQKILDSDSENVRSQVISNIESDVPDQQNILEK